MTSDPRGSVDHGDRKRSAGSEDFDLLGHGTAAEIGAAGDNDARWFNRRCGSPTTWTDGGCVGTHGRIWTEQSAAGGAASFRTVGPEFRRSFHSRSRPRKSP